jgi:hypothetical protein
MTTADWEPAARNHGTCIQDELACLHYGLARIRVRAFGIIAVLRWGHRGSSVSPSFDLSAQNPVGRVRRLGFCVLGDIPPRVILWLNSACGRRETMRPWTEAETRLLRARIRKKSARKKLRKASAAMLVR